MLGGVVGGVVVPDAPDDAAPGAAEDADRVGVGGAAGAGAGVDVGGPGVVVAAAVGERGDGVSESVVAGPAEAGALGLAGLHGDGGLAAVGGRGRLGGVAVAAVAHLGEDRGGADRGLGVAEQRAEGLRRRCGRAARRGSRWSAARCGRRAARARRRGASTICGAPRSRACRRGRCAAPRSRFSSSRAGRRPQ